MCEQDAVSLHFQSLKKVDIKVFCMEGVHPGALCTVPVIKMKIALLIFLVMCQENHGEGACMQIL